MMKVSLQALSISVQSPTVCPPKEIGLCRPTSVAAHRRKKTVFVYLNPFICTARFRYNYELLIDCFTVFIMSSEAAVACSTHIVALK